jgi:hypothetical protein
VVRDGGYFWLGLWGLLGRLLAGEEALEAGLTAASLGLLLLCLDLLGLFLSLDWRNGIGDYRSGGGLGDRFCFVCESSVV